MERIRNEQEIKEKILRAAIILIARDGFDKLRYADLTQSAGISMTTIRNYFKNKDGILTAIFFSIWSDIMNIVNRKLYECAGSDEITISTEILLTVVNYLFSDKNKDKLFILLFESGQKGYLETSAQNPITPMENFIGLLNNLFKNAQEKNILSKKVTPEDIGVISWTIVFNCLYRYYLKKYANEFGGIGKESLEDYSPQKILRFIEITLETLKT